ncbi:MAG: PKD domain-containing protein, partial [Thermoplasmata archaeon]
LPYLSNGTIIFINIRTMNGAGLFSPISSSSALTVLNPGPSISIDYPGGWYSSSLNLTLRVCTNSSEYIGNEADAEYRYAPISNGSLANFSGWMELEEDGGEPANGILIFSLQNGMAYQFRFRVRDSGGYWSLYFTSSNITMVDITPPTAVIILDQGEGEENGTLFCNFTASSDNESGLIGYWYSVGTHPGYADILSWQRLSNSTPEEQVNQLMIKNLILVHEQIYYINIMVENNAGLRSYASSEGIFCQGGIINNPPKAILLFPANNSSFNSSNITLSWRCTDAESTQINYSLYLSSDPNEVLTRSSTALIHSGTFYTSNLSHEFNVTILKNGTYYWTVIPHDGFVPGNCSEGFRCFHIILNQPIVNNQQPVAEFNISGKFYVNQPISFNATLSFDPDGVIVNYSWDLGDGNLSFGTEVNHVFSLPGHYIINLTVIDNNGSSNNISKNISIMEKEEEKETKGMLSDSCLYILVAGTIVALIIILILFIFLPKRKKKEQDAEENVLTATASPSGENPEPEMSGVPVLPAEQDAEQEQQKDNIPDGTGASFPPPPSSSTPLYQKPETVYKETDLESEHPSSFSSESYSPSQHYSHNYIETKSYAPEPEISQPSNSEEVPAISYYSVPVSVQSYMPGSPVKLNPRYSSIDEKLRKIERISESLSKTGVNLEKVNRGVTEIRTMAYSGQSAQDIIPHLIRVEQDLKIAIKQWLPGFVHNAENILRKANASDVRASRLRVLLEMIQDALAASDYERVGTLGPELQKELQLMVEEQMKKEEIAPSEKKQRGSDGDKLAKGITLDHVVLCNICRGAIKKGLPATRCICGKYFHDSCAARVGECPICGRKIL